MIRTRPLYDAGEMRAADAGAIAEIGIPGAVLMERAGLAAAREILSTYAGKTAAVVCGGGNNGGDGFVVARHLHAAGWEVECLLAADPAGLPEDAAVTTTSPRASACACTTACAGPACSAPA